MKMAETADEIREITKIEKVIEKAKGKLTLAEITSETGLPIEQARQTLNKLLERYQSKLQMNSDTGDLLFNFQYPMQRRDKVSFKENLIKVGDVLLKVFKAIYKASLGIVLVAYTVFFALLILVALSRSDSDDRRGGDNLISGLFSAIFDALWFRRMTAPVYEYVNDGAFKYKKVKISNNKGKGFIASVFSFVFGPEKIKYDPNLDSLEAIAYIKNNNGKLNTGDIVALTGANYSQAESKLAEYVGKYNGEIYINEYGVATAEFPQLLHKFNPALDGGKIEFYTNEIEPPVEFNGNTIGKNVLISIMNTFNLMMSYFIVTNADYALASEGQSFWFIALAGYFPLIISSLYFLIPLLRLPFYLKEKKNRKRNILRKEIIGNIIAKNGENVSPNNINIRGKENIYTKEDIENMLLDVSKDLQGETAIDKNGNAVFQFPRLAKELGAGSNLIESI